MKVDWDKVKCFFGIHDYKQRGRAGGICKRCAALEPYTHPLG